ncbi:MAG: metal-dependent transcriptional regulator [SAR324 cluster bacterium]|nr:metal-dependent transcriptional regulator [SAR324 cluster bacterium]
MSEDKNSVVIEEYLREIYLFQKGEDPLKAVHLASRMHSSPSTVHATLGRMQRDNLVFIDKKKNILLTEEGEEQAKDLAIRHNLSENFLCDILGIPWYEVHKHAHQLEHAMTPLVVEKLAKFLEHPEFCPHGVPLAGFGEDSFQNSFSLDEGQVGMSVKIMMIDESLEDSEELLKHLHEKFIVPGSVHAITERVDATHSLSIESRQGQVTLPFEIAGKIQVTRICSDS